MSFSQVLNIKQTPLSLACAGRLIIHSVIYSGASGVARQSCYLYITDHNGWTDSSTYTTPAQGASTIATVIEFQDTVKDPDWWAVFDKDDWTYFGEGFAIVTRYNSAFTNFHGTAASIYTHTWNSTQITSINISVNPSGTFIFNGSVGINISGTDAWGVASSQETSF